MEGKVEYLVLHDEVASEWLHPFYKVQEFMNQLGLIGINRNVKVQKFNAGRLEAELTYDFNGIEWKERRLNIENGTL